MLADDHPDRIQITFDDRRLVANAGLLLPVTLAQHLGLRELVDHHLDLGNAPGRANPGDKMLTLVASALAGGDCIDDADVLRTGGTAQTLGCVVKAPSTLGTFLRSFRWGHVRQLDRVSRELLARAWSAGAGPGDAPFTIDLDSTICETYGLAKEGARDHGYTGKRGYHPLLAVAAGTGDVLMARLREGRANTARGAAHFLRETVGRVRYAGARGQLTVRADSGFYTHAIVAACRRMDVRFSITVRQHARLRSLIEAIPEQDWTPIPYWMEGAADVAETSYTPFQSKPDAAPVRLIVRRVKPTPGSQLALFATYSYHGFITDREGETLELEADHRRHAEIENAIRDLKYGVGLNHLPSGRFPANGAWLAVQVIAHNLARWTARIGLGEQIVTTKTLRRRFFSMAGRLTRSARRLTLHLPQDADVCCIGLKGLRGDDSNYQNLEYRNLESSPGSVKADATRAPCGELEVERRAASPEKPDECQVAASVRALGPSPWEMEKIERPLNMGVLPDSDEMLRPESDGEARKLVQVAIDPLVGEKVPVVLEHGRCRHPLAILLASVMVLDDVVFLECAAGCGHRLYSDRGPLECPCHWPPAKAVQVGRALLLPPRLPNSGASRP